MTDRRENNGAKPNRASKIGRALNAIANSETMDGIALQRICLQLCETKTQATTLRQELMKRGFVKVLYHVTPAARDRAAKLARAV